MDPKNFPTAIAGISIVSEGRIQTVLNEVADEICSAADLPETGTRDALNLMVNAVLHNLFVDPEAELDSVVEASYDASYSEVLSWITD